MEAEEWISSLNLVPHPEGGYFRETYRAGEVVRGDALADRYGSERAVSTGIYFLLTSADRSTFHRVQSDELWHYHAGSSGTLHLIGGDGEVTRLGLGLALDKGQEPQRLVPAGTWFGATVDEQDSYVLVSCTVAPGFDFADFELAERAALIATYPQHRELITLLTKDDER